MTTVVDQLKQNVGQVVMGKEEEVEKILMAILCSGHILLEDIPGTGKTTLAKALSRSIGCQFKRIQFTPDLLPSDLTGINFYNQKEDAFIFREGPVFTHILLADEINRATPRTQSSLLECMEERQVTIDGQTYTLEAPFIVVATQNPIETQGTFPLPEAQLDRFFMRLSLGYPDQKSEIAILTSKERTNPLDHLQAVVSREDLIKAQEQIKEIHVSDEIKAYIVEIVRATRAHEQVKLGLSMRGTLAILRASQAHATLRGRDYVIPDDVKAVVKDVSSHRLILKGYHVHQTIEVANGILDEILGQIAVPIE